MSDANGCRDCGQVHRTGIDGIECDYRLGIERPVLGLTRAVQWSLLAVAGRADLVPASTPPGEERNG